MKFICSHNTRNREVVNLERVNSLQSSINGLYASITFYHEAVANTQWTYAGSVDFKSFCDDCTTISNAIQCSLQTPDYDIYEASCKA